MFKYLYRTGILFFITPILFSCINTKEAIYFNNIQDSTIQVTAESLEPVIAKNDLLSIAVSSANTEATQLFNSTNSALQAAGYLVNQEGYIQFPLVGNILAAGKTKKRLREEITKNLVDNKLLLQPIVDIRYLNFKVTVLGEVNHPTVMNVPNEKITLLEALGLAGDLTLNAKRNNILVIREEEGIKKIKRLNLNSTELFTSPYYYLKSNDIVYVEPNKSKIASSSNASQWIPIVISSLSLVLVAVNQFAK